MAKILVVEDEPELREIIALELNDVGHETCEAGNGKEALERAVEYQPEMIVSDITMPVMNGYQFFRNLREKHPEMSHTPFIFLSALADKNDVLKGYRLGADDYISKPIDFELLVVRIDARLRLAETRAAPDLGDDELDDDVIIIDDGDAGQEEPLAAEEEMMPPRNADTLVAAKLQTVSLDDIRAHCGDRWEEVSEKILRNAEQVIRSHLAEEDVFDQVQSGDFVVTFANPSSEAAAQKIRIIKDELWERLFGATDDEALSKVRSEVHEVEIAQEQRSPIKAFMGRVFEKIQEAGNLTGQKSQEKIKNIFQNEDIIMSGVLNSSAGKANITKFDFSSNVNSKIDKILSQEDFSLVFLSELNIIFLERVIDKIKLNTKSVAVFPMRFSMIVAENRGIFEKLLQSLDDSLQERILLERVDLPHRLRTVGDEMKPLSYGRKIQIAELRNPSQVIDFDIRKSRIGILSMNYEDVIYQHAKGAKDIIDEFKGFGGRLYIKNIPQKKISNAQKYEPDLMGLKF